MVLVFGADYADSLSGLSGLSGKKVLGATKVVWRVDAYGFYIGQSHADAIAVLQPAKLFEAFCQF